MNNLFSNFQEYRFPEILNTNNPLEQILTDINYSKIKSTLAYTWCLKEEGLAINKLNSDKEYFELEIYGGEDMVMMEEIIISISYLWGIEYYRELNSTTRANGLTFRWLDKNKMYQYYDEQSKNFEELNLENGFDHCFEYVHKLQAKGKIQPKEFEITHPNNLSFLDELTPIPNFLKEIEALNNQWEQNRKK